MVYLNLRDYQYESECKKCGKKVFLRLDGASTTNLIVTDCDCFPKLPDIFKEHTNSIDKEKGQNK